MKKSFHFGMILPNKFFTTDYGIGIRNILCKSNCVEAIVDFGDGQVFDKAGTYTTILLLTHAFAGKSKYINLSSIYKNSGRLGLAAKLSSSSIIFEELELPHDGSRWSLSVGDKGKILRAYP